MQVIHKEQTDQFILEIGDQTAFVNYSIRNGKMYLNHAQVPYQLRGKNYGKILVEGCFEILTQEGHEAVAVCSYIRLIAARSEKWRDIISH